MRIFIIFAVAVALIVVLGVLAGSGHAAVTCDRYASTTGSDANAGTQTMPYRTVQKLANSLLPDETGCLNGGTYTDGGATYVARITRDDITIASTPGQRATIKGTVYVVNGADRVTLTDLNLDGRRSNNVATPSPQIMAADTVVENSDIMNPTDICMIVGNLNGYGRALRPIIRDNVFHDCGSDTQLDHAIYLEAVDDAQVVRNTILRSAAYAIHMYPDSQRSYVADNTMSNGGGGVIFAGQGAYSSNGNIVERNVITGSKRKPAIESYWGGGARKGVGNVAQNNCLSGNLAGNVVTVNGGFTSTNNTVGTCPAVTPTPTPTATATASATPTPGCTP